MLSEIYDLVIGIIVFILILLSSYFPVEYFLNKIIGSGNFNPQGWKCEHPNRPIGKRCKQGKYWGDFDTKAECELFCGNIRGDDFAFDITKFENSLKAFGYNFPIPKKFLDEFRTSILQKLELWKEYEDFYEKKIYDRFRTVLMMDPYIYYINFVKLLETTNEWNFPIGKVDIYREVKFQGRGDTSRLDLDETDWEKMINSKKNIIIPIYFHSVHKVVLYIDKLNNEFFIFEPLEHIEADEKIEKYLKKRIIYKYFTEFKIKHLEYCLLRNYIFQDLEPKAMGYKKHILCLIFSFFYMILILLNPEKKSENLLNYFTMIREEYVYIFKIFFFWTYKFLLDNFTKNKQQIILENKNVLTKNSMTIRDMTTISNEKKSFIIDILDIILYKFDTENINIQFFFNYYIKIVNNVLKIFIDECDWTIPFFANITSMIKLNLENINNDDLMELKLFYFNFISKIESVDRNIGMYIIAFFNKLMKFEKIYTFTLRSLFLFLPDIGNINNVNDYVKLYKYILFFIDDDEKNIFVQFLFAIYTLSRDFNKHKTEIEQEQIPIIVNFIKKLKNKEDVVSALKEITNEPEYSNIKIIIEKIIIEANK